VIAFDLEKLDRIEERAASANAVLSATFDRYRQRINSAAEKRQRALSAPAAQYSFGHMSLAELARVSPEDLAALGADNSLLTSAFRDLKAAGEIYAEYQRMTPGVQQQVGLAHRLRRHVGRE